LVLQGADKIGALFCSRSIKFLFRLNDLTFKMDHETLDFSGTSLFSLNTF